jgi:hypothetical protein
MMGNSMGTGSRQAARSQNRLVAARFPSGARRSLVAALGVAVVAVSLGGSTEGQSARPPYRIGVLWDVKTVPPSVTPLAKWLAEDLVAHGLADGDFRLIVRQGEEPGAFRQGARDLLRERVHVIWASTGLGARCRRRRASSYDAHAPGASAGASRAVTGPRSA